jgi:hypothetical protein
LGPDLHAGEEPFRAELSEVNLGQAAHSELVAQGGFVAANCGVHEFGEWAMSHHVESAPAYIKLARTHLIREDP